MPEQSLKERTAKSFLWSGFGTFATQVMNMLFGIVIARILLPEDYGIVGLLTIFGAIAYSLQESGLTSALINKKDCRHEDYNAVFWFCFLTGLTLYTILFFSTPWIAKFYHIPELKSLGRISFLGFVFSSLGIVPYAILLKTIQAKKMAIINLVANALSGIGGIIMACCGMAYWGLALQSIGMIFIRTLLVWMVSYWRPTFHINLRPVIPLWKFGINILLTSIFGHIINNLLTIFLGRFSSKTAVGYYNQAYKWNNMAFASLAAMTNNTSQSVFVQSDDAEDRSRRVLRKMTRFMAFISFPCMLGLALIAPEFIIITITEKWTNAIPLLRVLCIGGSFMSLMGIFSNFILSRGKSNVTLVTVICQFIVQLSVVYLFRKTGIFYMTMAFTFVYPLWLLVWQLLVRREIHLRLRDTLADILPFFVIASAVMFATHFITLPIANIYLRIFAKIGCAVVLYAMAMRLCNAQIYREFIAYAKGGIKKVLNRE